LSDFWGAVIASSLPLGNFARKLKRLNFHLIEADDLIGIPRST
jgi:hypothetical protein